jgi:hypothetical protein
VNNSAVVRDIENDVALGGAVLRKADRKLRQHGVDVGTVCRRLAVCRRGGGTLFADPVLKFGVGDDPYGNLHPGVGDATEFRALHAKHGILLERSELRRRE